VLFVHAYTAIMQRHSFGCLEVLNRIFSRTMNNSVFIL